MTKPLSIEHVNASRDGLKTRLNQFYRNASPSTRKAYRDGWIAAESGEPGSVCPDMAANLMRTWYIGHGAFSTWLKKFEAAINA